MRNREELQTIFEDILGSRNVYFQHPPDIKMQYPAIVYARKKLNTIFADNAVYITTPVYDVTVIDKDPDSEIVSAISALPRCSHERHFRVVNLNHDVFTLHHK